MTSEGEEDILGESDDLFKDPNDFYQLEKPATFEEYTLLSGRKLRLRLVGHNPLWVRRTIKKTTSMPLT